MGLSGLFYAFANPGKGIIGVAARDPARLACCCHSQLLRMKKDLSLLEWELGK
jgi:hypothetical protein